MNEKVLALAQKHGAHGNFAATHNGQLLFNTAAGYADREKGIPYNTETRTYVASVTKQFTAAAVMMLQEKGLLDIDDKLEKYVPEYRYADRMTLRQMLNMTSGIPNELSVIGERLRKRRAEFDMTDADFERMVSRAMAPEKCTPADFLEIVNAEPMSFEPGERFEYSDTNYMLLGDIVARVTGIEYSEFMRRNIFEPLGMNSTVIGADNSEAPSYAEYGGSIYNMGYAHFTTGEGSICTNARELCLWLDAVLKGRFISRESWDECFRLVHDAYGFGWHKNGGWYLHGGGDLGYSSMVWIHPGKQVAIAGAMNVNAGRFYSELLELVKRELNIDD